MARLPPSKYKYESEVTKTRDAKLSQRPNTTPATKTTNPPAAEEEKAMTYCFCLPATDWASFFLIPLQGTGAPPSFLSLLLTIPFGFVFAQDDDDPVAEFSPNFYCADELIFTSSADFKDSSILDIIKLGTIISQHHRCPPCLTRSLFHTPERIATPNLECYFPQIDLSALSLSLPW